MPSLSLTWGSFKVVQVTSSKPSSTRQADGLDSTDCGPDSVKSSRTLEERCSSRSFVVVILKQDPADDDDYPKRGQSIEWSRSVREERIVSRFIITLGYCDSTDRLSPRLQAADSTA